MGLGLFPVDGGIDLRHVDLIAGEQPGQLRHVMALGDDVLGFLVQRLVTQVATVFDLQAETTDGAQPLYRRRWEDGDVGVFDIGELRVQRGGNRRGRLARVFTLIERLERGEHDAAVRAVGEAVDRQAREGHRVGHARLLEGDLAHLLDHRFRAVEAGGIRQLREGDQVLFVLRRHETGRRRRKAQPGHDDQATVDEQGDAAAADDPADRADVAMAGPVEEAVERAEQPATEQALKHFREAVFRGVVLLEQYGGQGRRQGQGVERRDHRRDGNGQGELLVELPGKAGDECSRHEHGAQHQGGGNDRAGHFTHGFLCGFQRFQAQADVTFDVFHHDDGVVHHDTDGQHQAEQR
ncbi:hypothetical protein D3C81_1064430 [compost metagenome]